MTHRVIIDLDPDSLPAEAAELFANGHRLALVAAREIDVSSTSSPRPALIGAPSCGYGFRPANRPSRAWRGCPSRPGGSSGRCVTCTASNP